MEFGGCLVAKSCLILATSRTATCQLVCPWDSLGKNTGVGCHFLLQGTSLLQGSNPGLLHCRQTLLTELQGKSLVVNSWSLLFCLKKKKKRGIYAHMHVCMHTHITIRGRIVMFPEQYKKMFSEFKD